MTSLKQKREERFYAESANRLLGHLWTLVDIKEPPDFEVRADHQTFGLEVRRVFADLETDTGSKQKSRITQLEAHTENINFVLRRWREKCIDQILL